MKRNYLNQILYFIVFLAVTINFVYGAEFRSRDNVSVGPNEIIEDDLYLFGKDIEVRGQINGQLTSFCYSMTSNGKINGGADLFAYDIDITGTVQNSIRAFGQTVRINCPVGGNLICFGEQLKIGRKGVIGKEIHAAGGRFSMMGLVRENVWVEADEVVISGQIMGNLDVEAKSLIIVFLNIGTNPSNMDTKVIGKGVDQMPLGK